MPNRKRKTAAKPEISLDPLGDDLDALALGPTGVDGIITDPEVARAFKAEQIGHGEATGRARVLAARRLQVGLDPNLATGDPDVALGDAALVGEEGIGGGQTPPEANDVEEIGRAVGVHFQDGEPLTLEDKLVRRDQHRWELDPASAEDWHQRQREAQAARRASTGGKPPGDSAG
jgi:hypothetical protein